MTIGGPVGNRRRSRFGNLVLVALTAACALLAIAECLGAHVGFYDDGLYYFGALLVSRGQTVHLDFTSIYPPFNYQPIAWMFSLLGETVLAARLVHVLLYLVFLGGLASLFRLRGFASARLAALMLASVVLTATLPSLPSFPGVALALLSVVAYLHSLEAKSHALQRAARVVAGGLAALTLFTRVNFGLYVLALFGIDGVIALVQARRERDQRFSARALETGELAIAVALGVAGLAATFRQQLPALVDQVLVAPSLALWNYSMPAFGPHGEGGAGALLLVFTSSWLALRAPLPRLRRVWVATTLAVFVLGVIAGRLSPHKFTLLVLFAIAAPVVNQLTRAALRRSEFAALLTCSVFLHYYVNRPDFPHQFPATAPVVFLLPVLANASDSWPARFQWRAALALVTLLALPVGLRTAQLYRRTPTGIRLLASDWRTPDSERIAASRTRLLSAFSVLYPDQNENDVVRFLRQRTDPGEPVYVGLQDHSRPFANDMRLYFALGLRPGTRRFMLGSGLSNSPEAENEMVHDLKTRGVRWIVLWQNCTSATCADPQYQNFLRQNPPGSRILDDYLNTHYGPVAEFGPFEVRQRQGR